MDTAPSEVKVSEAADRIEAHNEYETDTKGHVEPSVPLLLSVRQRIAKNRGEKSLSNSKVRKQIQKNVRGRSQVTMTLTLTW